MFKPCTIRGRLLTLRDWSADDVYRWVAWLSPGQRWQYLDGPYFPKPSSSEIDAMVTRKREEIASAHWPTPRKQLVISDRDSDLLIGLVTWYWESEETHWARS